jgi:hypothetical protein
MNVAMVPETGVRLSARDDVHDAPAAVLAEFDGARRKREQCVVAAAANIASGMEMCTALTNQNLARVHNLPPKALHAKALGI